MLFKNLLVKMILNYRCVLCDLLQKSLRVFVNKSDITGISNVIPFAVYQPYITLVKTNYHCLSRQQFKWSLRSIHSKYIYYYQTLKSQLFANFSKKVTQNYWFCTEPQQMSKNCRVFNFCRRNNMKNKIKQNHNKYFYIKSCV